MRRRRDSMRYSFQIHEKIEKPGRLRVRRGSTIAMVGATVARHVRQSVKNDCATAAFRCFAPVLFAAQCGHNEDRIDKACCPEMEQPRLTQRPATGYSCLRNLHDSSDRIKYLRREGIFFSNRTVKRSHLPFMKHPARKTISSLIGVHAQRSSGKRGHAAL
jgi:hypothetical protein